MALVGASVAVSVAAERASVRWNAADGKNIAAVLSAISQAGFTAKEISADNSASSKQNRWHWNLIIGLAVTGALMIGEWIFHFAMTPWFRWLAFALAAIVQVFCGAQFYRGAWRQLKVGSFARSERMAKWNEAIRIEEAMGHTARFAGDSYFGRSKR